MVDIVEDRYKLTAEGIVELFKIELLNGGVIRIKANNTVSWQGHSYEGYAVQMTGVNTSSDEELSRPNLALANPDGIFSAFIIGGTLEKALVTRYLILKANLDANLNVAEAQSWYVSRVVSLNKISCQLELRNPIDGPQFLCPARMFIPPEFKTVGLT